MKPTKGNCYTDSVIWIFAGEQKKVIFVHHLFLDMTRCLIRFFFAISLFSFVACVPNSGELKLLAIGISASGDYAVGEVVQLEVFPTPGVASLPQILWSSSNPTVATVDDKGVLTAQSVGTATITAQTADKALSAMLPVTIYATLSHHVILTTDYAEILDGKVVTYGTITRDEPLPYMDYTKDSEWMIRTWQDNHWGQIPMRTNGTWHLSSNLHLASPMVFCKKNDINVHHALGYAGPDGEFIKIGVEYECIDNVNQPICVPEDGVYDVFFNPEKRIYKVCKAALPVGFNYLYVEHGNSGLYFYAPLYDSNTFSIANPATVPGHLGYVTFARLENGNLIGGDQEEKRITVDESDLFSLDGLDSKCLIDQYRCFDVGEGRFTIQVSGGQAFVPFDPSDDTRMYLFRNWTSAMACVNGVYYPLCPHNGTEGSCNNPQSEPQFWRFSWTWSCYDFIVCDALINASPSAPVDIIMRDIAGRKYTLRFTESQQGKNRLGTAYYPYTE